MLWCAVLDEQLTEYIQDIPRVQAPLDTYRETLTRMLVDAWDTSKRSREYLNSLMDKYDLDNLYYSKAYNETTTGCNANM